MYVNKVWTQLGLELGQHAVDDRVGLALSERPRGDVVHDTDDTRLGDLRILVLPGSSRCCHDGDGVPTLAQRLSERSRVSLGPCSLMRREAV